jgi:Na+/phosphate symporter
MDLDMLNKNKKQGTKLLAEIDDLRDSIFYFIKNLDEGSLGASNFYINILGYLQDMAQSLEYIGKVCHNHVNNNHKKLKYNQIKELKEIDLKLEEILHSTRDVFDEENFDKLKEIVDSKQELFDMLSQKIEKQVARTRTEESSPKNTTLYFSLLLETKDFVNATMNLLEQYREAHEGTLNQIPFSKLNKS